MHSLWVVCATWHVDTQRIICLYDVYASVSPSDRHERELLFAMSAGNCLKCPLLFRSRKCTKETLRVWFQTNNNNKKTMYGKLSIYCAWLIHTQQQPWPAESLIWMHHCKFVQRCIAFCLCFIAVFVNAHNTHIPYIHLHRPSRNGRARLFPKSNTNC